MAGWLIFAKLTLLYLQTKKLLPHFSNTQKETPIVNYEGLLKN